jgi:putative transposase
MALFRKPLNHPVPPWVEKGSLFFVTLCCEQRGRNQLCLATAGRALLDTVRYYHEHQRWFARLFLLMPDHVHALLAFPQVEERSEVIRNWKGYTARKLGVRWQRNYFDHRLRNIESWERKAEYVRQNPLRAGLIADAALWPFVIEN